MIRLLPRSLPGQFALVMASALLIASVVNFALLLSERHRAAIIEQSGPPMARFVDVADTVFSEPPPDEGRPIPIGRRGPSRYAVLKHNPIVVGRLPRDAGLEQRLAIALADNGIEAVDIAASSRTVLRAERRGGGRRNNDSAEDFPPDELPPGPPPEAQTEAPPASAPSGPPPNFRPPPSETNEIVLAARLPDGRWLSSVTFSPEPTRGDVFLLAGSTIITFVFVLAAALWIAGRLARPLRDLTAAAGRIGESSEPQQVVARGPGDVQQTIDAFNAMSRRVNQLLKEKDVMLGALGHDLRTPLASLRIRIESMEPEAEREKAVRTIEEANELLEDILELSRQGKSSEPERAMDVSMIVEDLVEDYAETGAAVTLGDMQRAVAVARPVLLRRALRNLIDNAVAYGGNARVSVVCGPSGASIHVDDDGPGMPAEALINATEPFYRGENSRNRSTGGAGLGLTLSEAIARAHGGTLKLSNRQPRGLRATVSLPPHAAS